MRKVPAFVVVLILSVHPAVVPAQSTNGSISGRVIDPSHAVIANANVTAVNAGTNFRYETTTNNSGEYYLTNLPRAAIAWKSKRLASRSCCGRLWSCTSRMRWRSISKWRLASSPTPSGWKRAHRW